ncbi:hypothetical protein TspCOW1_12550 [Thiohalobacter sp. COW1]|uniref:hypothetical protein n=1 Tax=Thiohalobacter sp. COW1 TaxID=2795687 RepID=UPI001915933F|nr:hypothetical protein [Thiohalobacter sp. COW1]BCO31152.1 hypothetical protein TspCOW1_12550 [Thiohalobacter sp. COW1]
MTLHLLPQFLDIEASSLGRDSYPIEIAWSYPNGEVEAHLIDPYHILDWTDWDPAAQAVHGLSRRYLSEHGADPKLVAGRIQAVLAGQPVYSDAPDYDQGWLETLFGDALGVRSPVRLHPIWALWPDARGERLHELYDAAWADVEGQPHRAGIDVRHRLAWYLRAKAEFGGVR